MDIRKDLETLCDVVSDQIGDITRKIQNGGMSSGNLDTLDKLTHTMKSIKGVMAMMDDENGYSGRGSYRGSYARRDGMGRYSGERGYSRTTLADKMRALADEAPDDRTRHEIMRMIEKLDV